jgi:protoheme IX farnesyltransferase
VIQPAEALAFGIALGVAALLVLGLFANGLAAPLAAAAILLYVLVYTMGLKRRTASNIVIGGAAGCFPVLVGWAAVTGTVGLPAVILFAVIFLWTPPHFWALAIKLRDDYAAAGVVMLPVVAPDPVSSWASRMRDRMNTS